MSFKNNSNLVLIDELKKYFIFLKKNEIFLKDCKKYLIYIIFSINLEKKKINSNSFLQLRQFFIIKC